MFWTAIYFGSLKLLEVSVHTGYAYAYQYIIQHSVLPYYSIRVDLLSTTAVPVDKIPCLSLFLKREYSGGWVVPYLMKIPEIVLNNVLLIIITTDQKLIIL